MQSTAPSNQYFWKVVTNGPQGEESTLNTYKASFGILASHWECHILFSLLVSAKVQWPYNVYEMEIQPIHLAFIVSLELSDWFNSQNKFIYWYPRIYHSACSQRYVVFKQKYSCN